MDAAWWVSINGDQKGPFSTATLKQWFAEGKIPPEALVRPDNGAWMLAKKLKLKRTDWHALFGGVVLAAGLLLALETYWLFLTNPPAGRWTLGLLVVYAFFALRILWRKRS
jgi:hypothetical protein